MLRLQVPFAAFTENFSSIERKAPPPFGREIVGGVATLLADDSSVRLTPEAAAFLPPSFHMGSNMASPF
jgi:hypothetical protein